MERSIILTANAGVILSVSGKEILIDALHCDKVPSFSTVPPAVLEAVWDRYKNKAPDAVLATHVHYDHVSPSLWNKARRRWPSGAFIAPVAYLGGTVVLTEQRQTVSVAGITVDAMRLPHDGAKYKLLYNYGYFLDIGGFTVLYPGDCAHTAAPMLSELIGGRHVDLALMNFPWIALTRSRAFVREAIAPTNLIVFHLPFEQDDLGGYRRAAFRAAGELPSQNVHVLSEPFQKIVVEK